MKEQTFVSVVAYAYNQEPEAELFIKRIDAVIREGFEMYEIIIVNDYSTDDTLAKLRKASRLIAGTVIILNLPRKHGKERAMLAGLDRCVGDFVYEFDTLAMNYPIQTVNDLYTTATNEGYDMVAACSNHNSSIPSKLFYSLINRVSYLKLNLSTESFRLVTRRSLNAMLSLKEKVRYRKALYAFTGYSSKNYIYPTLPNVSKEKTRINSENISLAMDVILSFSDLGPRLSTYFSLAFLMTSLSMILYSLMNFFFNRNVVVGWTTETLFISIGFSGLFFILGILGQYIIRVLTEVQSRPLYTHVASEMYKGSDTMEISSRTIVKEGNSSYEVSGH